ncbi:MAG: UDP-N-acetylmuramoyl-L-alanyl-D-glutamate--2,6-diaminopimelate ligase [Clostridiales bacterium]|nr:UDP-N-acetylmuramoyl-L-alanyl-D-glutamate--2,6-diaminopimelate ligase [Clostridiales bacterium]
MKLSKLLERLEYEILGGNPDIEIDSLVYDSRKAGPGSVFVCINGTVTNGHKFIPNVCEAGCRAIIVTQRVDVPEGVTVVKVKDDRIALAYMSAAFFDYPAEKLTTIGLTGTKGKTTSTFMVYKVLTLAGIKTGLIGTIESIIGDEHIPASHSTPESYTIQELFSKMVKAGIRVVVMEVSSQGLKMNRVAGINFDIGVFTNLEPDHIGGNEHPDFEDYLDCKRRLFSMCKTGIANKDSEHFDEMMKGHTCELYTFGTDETCDYRAVDIELCGKKNGKDNEMSSAGIKYRAVGKREMDVYVDIPGRFTVYNSLTALAICDILGVDSDTIYKGLSTVKVNGRVETVPVSDDYTIMVDYAHNEMSLRSVLMTLREYEPKRLVCVFGCGGNRSKERRFTMGAVSGKYSDLTVITSDNPRYEKPADIIADIESSISKVEGAKYVIIEDRYEAIKYCIDNAQKGDLILVAGKGHENYQEIEGVKYHMDDKELILKAAGMI